MVHAKEFLFAGKDHMLNGDVFQERIFFDALRQILMTFDTSISSSYGRKQ